MVADWRRDLDLRIGTELPPLLEELLARGEEALFVFGLGYWVVLPIPVQLVVGVVGVEDRAEVGGEVCLEPETRSELVALAAQICCVGVDSTGDFDLDAYIYP